MTRERSNFSRVSSGSDVIRCSITGITAIESHCSEVAASRHDSGSKRRRSTIVEPSSIESAKCANPHVWKSGAAMCVRQP